MQLMMIMGIELVLWKPGNFTDMWFYSKLLLNTGKNVSFVDQITE